MRSRRSYVGNGSSAAARSLGEVREAGAARRGRHVAEDSRGAARRVLSKTLEAASTLTSFAERGRVVPELGDPAIREVFVYSHRLLYEIRNDTVAVIGFVHGSRYFDDWWRRSSLDTPLPPLTE